MEDKNKKNLFGDDMRKIIWDYLKELQAVYFRIDLVVRKQATFLLEEGVEEHVFLLGNGISLSQEEFSKILADFYLIEAIIPSRAYFYKEDGLLEMKRYIIRIEKFLSKYIPDIQMPLRPKELVEWLEGKDV